MATNSTNIGVFPPKLFSSQPVQSAGKGMGGGGGGSFGPPKPSTKMQPVSQRKTGGAALDMPAKGVTSSKPPSSPALTQPSGGFVSSDPKVQSQISAMQGQVNSQAQPQPQSPPASPSPTTPANTVPDSTPSYYKDYINTLRDYMNTIKSSSQPTALEQADTDKLNALQSLQDNLGASEALGLSAIKDQPIELGLQVGQASKLKENAAAQMQALEARMTPLEKQIAREQTNRTNAMQAAQQGAGVAGNILGAEVPKPITVGYGQTLVNPMTGEVIAQGQQRMSSDAQNYALAQQQGFQGSFMDFMQSKGMSYQSPQGIQSMADAVLNGQMAPSQVPGGSRGAIGIAVRDAILQQNPNFDFEGADAQFAFGKNTGIIQQVAKINGLTAPGGAIDQLKQLSNSVPRSQFPNFNKLTLGAAMASGDPNVAAYLAGAKLVGDEIGNALAASGGSDLKVQLGLSQTDPNMTIEQLNAVLNSAIDQLKSRAGAYTNVSPVLGGLGSYGYLRSGINPSGGELPTAWADFGSPS